MWTVHQLRAGRLHVLLGTSPSGWPFALTVLWERRGGRQPFVLCDLGRGA